MTTYTRREALGLLGKGFLVSCVAGGGLLNSLGCAANKDITSKKAQNRLEDICQSSENIKDPHNLSQYLNENEYVVPDNVFDSYAKTVDKRPDFGGAPAAGYLRKNYLDTEEELKEFDERLNKLNLNEKETETYQRLFTSEDIIVLKESALKNKEKFSKFLPHERFHKNIKQINKDDYEYMINVANELIWKKTDEGERLTKEKITSDYVGGFAVMEASENPEEFYTYLAQGEFMPRVKETLKKEYPKAYDLFKDIKDTCKIK